MRPSPSANMRSALTFSASSLRRLPIVIVRRPPAEQAAPARSPRSPRPQRSHARARRAGRGLSSPRERSRDRIRSPLVRRCDKSGLGRMRLCRSARSRHAWRAVSCALLCAASSPASSSQAARRRTAADQTRLRDRARERDRGDHFGAGSPAPYLATTLPSEGAFIPNYYGIGHESLDNYIAMISGQAPNAETQSDCKTFTRLPEVPLLGGQEPLSGCVYPSNVPTLPAQLEAKRLTWRSYDESMGAEPARESATCGHPAVGGLDNTQVATEKGPVRHPPRPLRLLQAIISDPGLCDRNVVNLDKLARSSRLRKHGPRTTRSSLPIYATTATMSPARTRCARAASRAPTPSLKSGCRGSPPRPHIAQWPADHHLRRGGRRLEFMLRGEGRPGNADAGGAEPGGGSGGGEVGRRAALPLHRPLHRLQSRLQPLQHARERRAPLRPRGARLCIRHDPLWLRCLHQPDDTRAGSSGGRPCTAARALPRSASPPSAPGS